MLKSTVIRINLSTLHAVLTSVTSLYKLGIITGLPLRYLKFIKALFSSVTQSFLTLWDPMDCSTPGFLVHHQLPEFAQAHVHRVGDAIQPSHPLSSPSPPTFNLSQNQGLFKWVSSGGQSLWWLSNYKVTNLASFKSRIDFLICTVLPVRRRRPTPVLLPGKSHGRRNLVGCSPWGRKEWDTTERLHFQFSL